MGSFVIRSLGDFLRVPAPELANCLAAFRRAIESRKQLLAAAAGQGADATALAFTEFEWKPREKSAPLADAITATTEVGGLGLKPAAVHKFRDLNLYALEDFAHTTAHELRAMPDVGSATVEQIRGLLESVGLSFRAPTNRYHQATERAKVAQSLSPEKRREGLSDESDIADLGLKWTTLSRCIQKDIHTVGDLRKLTLRALYVSFGSQGLIGLMEGLDAVRLPLHSQPSQLERWRHSAIRRDALKHPEDSAPVLELQPWLGGLPAQLARHGVATVGELRQLAAAGGQRFRGVGQASWDRVFDYFGVRRHPVPKN